MKELYAHCIVLVSAIFAPLVCHASFGANSADLSTVPFAHMAAGGSRNYDGLGDYAGYSYQDNYSTETLLGVTCLKWVSPTPSGADSSMKHDDIRWLARDVSGSIWVFKQERDGKVGFCATNLASLRPVDQTIPGKLMTGNYGVGTSTTSTGDDGKTYVIQIISTNAILAEFSGFYFVLVRETEQSSGYFDEYYYHESAGMVKNLINTNEPGVYKGWEFAGGLSAHSGPAITVQPQSQTNLVGTTETFSVTVAGSTPLFYHWRKNGTNLIDGGNISGATTTNLIISNLQSNNAGKYSVVITNSYGSVTSSVAALTVLARVRPTLTVTSPTANQRWSNVLFIATGTAAGNAGLAGIWVNVNASGWIPGYGTTSWTSTNRLTPGTNVMQFFALDTNGICSLTNQISLDYVVPNQLQIRTIGLGTIPPNFSNAWLNIGQNYSITSSPAIGFEAANWVISTNWLGGVATGGKVVQFMMASNLTLTVNFVDTNRPAVSITNLVSGQRVSNAVFTVRGKAADNWQVAGVKVQANYRGWTSAVGTNNWSAQLNLAPGTNTVQAYAVDNSGNVSLTNTINIFYVVSAPLTVQIVGAGAVSPNYSGELLALGANYTMKATASNGFAFYYWGGGVTMTTNHTLNFTMSSNLSITANFVDVTKPVATITYPIANQKWSNSVITVAGKASDNVGVAEVWCRINGGGWALAQTRNGFSDWTAPNLPVQFGTNTIQAIALDAAGNVSLTNAVKCLGILAPASLAGYQGTIKPNVGKQQLIMTWGDDTWAQTGASGDTNADDYLAGSYSYFQTGPNTAILTNMDIGMMSGLGTTNITIINLMFTSATTANCAWTNSNRSGSGTMTLSPISNLVPESIGGRVVRLVNNGKGPILTFNEDGTFVRTQDGNTNWGNYSFIQYSPTVGVIQQNMIDPIESGALGFVELNFATTNSGFGFGVYYQNPAYGRDPDDAGAGIFNIK